MHIRKLGRLYLDEPSKKLGRSKLNTSTETHTRMIVAAFPGKEVEDICETDVRRFFGNLRKKGLSNDTYMCYRSVFYALMNFAVEELKVISDFPKVKPLPKLKREAFLSPDQISKLLSACDPLRRDILKVLFHTGQRRNTIQLLRIDQVVEDGTLIRLSGRDTKNGRPIEIPLNEVAQEVVKRRIALSQALAFENRWVKDVEFVFCQRDGQRHLVGKPLKTFQTKRWYAMLRSIGMEWFRPHDARHTFASLHCRAGTDIRMVQKLGGWECIESMNRYTHINTPEMVAASQVTVGFGF